MSQAANGGVAYDGNENSALPAGFFNGVAQVGKVEDGNSEELEKCVFGSGLVIGNSDGPRNQFPIWFRYAAIGHHSVDDFEAVFA